MKNKSIWEDYSKKNNQNKEEKKQTNEEQLKEKNKVTDKNTKEINQKTNSDNNKELNNLQTDILIIGAGITGLTTAYFLKDTNKKITIIDKSEVGRGITSKTTAKITYLQQDIYSKLTEIHNKEIAKKYYNSQKEAINTIIKIIKENNISCDLEKVDSILFTKEEKNITKLNSEKEILSTWNAPVKDYQDEFIKNGFIVNNTYTFNPLKYLNTLKQIIENKVTIFENTLASSIKKEKNIYLIETNKGTINANIIVLACHYPFFIYPFFFPLKTYIEREYVNASKIKEPKKITSINIDKDLYSVRYYKDYLIYGSNEHKLTNNINYQKKYNQSKKNFIKYFNQEPTYTWMNQDIISNDSLPFIGKIKDNIYISSAYNTWGMTNGTIGGKIISDLIQEKENKYTTLFNPNRKNIPLVINSIFGLFPYLKAYIEGLFHKSNPYYIKIKGLIYGVYIDEQGIKHKIRLICPHMKCPLVFNQEEKTWDCPCHGSRFDLDGNILETPATKNISTSE